MYDCGIAEENYIRRRRGRSIMIHMPQKWDLSSSVNCFFRKTRANRILVKQCIVFIGDCDAQGNQNFGTHRE